MIHQKWTLHKYWEHNCVCLSLSIFWYWPFCSSSPYPSLWFSELQSVQRKICFCGVLLADCRVLHQPGPSCCEQEQGLSLVSTYAEVSLFAFALFPFFEYLLIRQDHYNLYCAISVLRASAEMVPGLDAFLFRSWLIALWISALLSVLQSIGRSCTAGWMSGSISMLVCLGFFELLLPSLLLLFHAWD